MRPFSLSDEKTGDTEVIPLYCAPDEVAVMDVEEALATLYLVFDELVHVKPMRVNK